MKKLEKLTLKELEFEVPVLPQTIQEQLKGGDVTILFDRSDSKIYIYCNGALYASYNAANNTASGSQGQWSNGTYSMMDSNSSYHHGASGGDTFEGSYGTNGIYRANTFTDANGCVRTGMGLHAGRSDNYNYSTYGCIRTTEAAMNDVQCCIGSSGGLSSISVRD